MDPLDLQRWTSIGRGGGKIPTQKNDQVLPFFEIGHVPELTALAASVYATMIFPQADQRLDRIACAQAICLDWRARYVRGNIEEELPIVRRELFAVLDLHRRHSFDNLTSFRDEGISAGSILKFVLVMDRDSEAGASVKKAVFLLSQLEPVSERTLMTRWSHFRDVSPLWAAYNDFCGSLQKVGPEWQITAWLSFMKDPRPVLAIAEHYRKWGAQHIPKGSTGNRTLDSQVTWRAPNQIGHLPEADFFNPQRLYVGLTPGARALLESYRRV